MMTDFPRESQIPQLKQLWKTAFGDEDRFIEDFFSHAFSSDRCLCALDGGQTTGMLYWLPCRVGEDALAYVYAVATHPDHRGKGICAGLMKALHDLLATEGYVGALLYPQEERLRDMYRKMGYKATTYLSEIVCSMGTAPAPIHAVTAEEYFRLRGAFLPKNSVIQEEPFVTLLKDGLRFYQGPGFLLAAAVRETELFGAEFLGNTQAMPGVLNALGIPFGRFRTPGSKLPFAMFRPLKPGTTCPDYFAFPMD